MKLVIEIPNEVYSHAKDVENRLLTPREEIVLQDSVANGTPLDSIIADIEAARDKDKLCEYPYNRCIDILTRTD